MKVSNLVAKNFVLGDETAISEVYYKYRGLLYFIISSYVKTKEDCEDVYQNVFVSILEKKGNISDASSLHSYLCMTAKNQAINYAKQSSRYVLMENDEDVSSSDNERLNDLLPYNLTKEEKLVVGYKLCFGLTYKEISDIMNTPIPTLKVRYFQALKKVKEANL